MNWTRLLMSVSALILGLLGVAATFAPDQILLGLDAPQSPALLLLVQVLGALYLGFAGLNWMTRHNLIGGIYSRPVAIGNLMHFLVAGLAMVKLLLNPPSLPWLWPLAIMYVGFGAAFGIILVRQPVRASAADQVDNRP